MSEHDEQDEPLVLGEPEKVPEWVGHMQQYPVLCAEIDRLTAELFSAAKQKLEIEEAAVVRLRERAESAESERDQLREWLRAEADAFVNDVPSNWLDSIITGPTAVFRAHLPATTNVELVLCAVKQRIRERAESLKERVNAKA